MNLPKIFVCHFSERVVEDLRKRDHDNFFLSCKSVTSERDNKEGVSTFELYFYIIGSKEEYNLKARINNVGLRTKEVVDSLFNIVKNILGV
jgi:hypothetical protein